MTAKPVRHLRPWLAFVAFLTLAVLVAVIWIFSDATGTGDLPPLADSGFLNSKAGVEFVGASRCVACHAQAHASFVPSAHGRALAIVDPKTEPPDGEFEDPNTLRKYRLYRRDGEFRHEESIDVKAVASLVLADHPVKYVIGSGRFSRSYLIEHDGFLFESPATWYASRAGWGLSPGYERFNPGFQRPVEFRCVHCHAGRVEMVRNSPHRLRFLAQSIDCERCHGPGSLHVERWEKTPAEPLVGVDRTIVNPARLDRDRSEDVCAQCHFHSAATVEVRGRQLADFRPGQRLDDYLQHYGVEDSSGGMEVVGHVEQMRLSACRKGSSTLTCITCHNPHENPEEAEKPAYFRAKCLNCHEPASCRAPNSERQATSPADSCVVCHMPNSPTDIPHFAFTHHRIGLHARQPRSAEQPRHSGQLILLSETSPPDERDRMRNLGLAYLQYSDATGHARADWSREQARELLSQVRRKGFADPELLAALARLELGRDDSAAKRFAELALFGNPSSEAQASATFTLGALEFSAHHPETSRRWLEQARELRETPGLWMMIALCRRDLGDLSEAIVAARKAVHLAPDRSDFRKTLIELLGQAGRSAEAEEESRNALQLLRYQKFLEERISRDQEE